MQYKVIQHELVTLLGPILSHIIRALQLNNVYIAVLSLYSHDSLLSGPVFQPNALFVSDFTKGFSFFLNS